MLQTPHGWPRDDWPGVALRLENCAGELPPTPLCHARAVPRCARAHFWLAMPAALNDQQPITVPWLHFALWALHRATTWAPTARAIRPEGPRGGSRGLGEERSCAPLFVSSRAPRAPMSHPADCTFACSEVCGMWRHRCADPANPCSCHSGLSGAGSCRSRGANRHGHAIYDWSAS